MCMQQEGLCEQVLALLLASCEGEEECRNVVAECMGHLALLNPTQVRPFSRATAYSADESKSMQMRARLIVVLSR